METPLFQSLLLKFYQTNSGRAFFELEAQLVKRALKNVFGYYLLQVGLTSSQELLGSNRVSHKLLVDSPLSQEAENLFQSMVEADLDYLPIKADTVDVVFLPHTLESVEDPYHLLRQIDALLIPEGRLIITGFNPHACGVVKKRLGSSKDIFKQANLIRISRLVDWLKLLGYEVEHVEITPTACFVSKNNQAWWVVKKMGKILSWLGVETGNIYCVSAVKRISSPTPTGLNWKLSHWLPVKKSQTLASSRQSNAND